MFSFLLFFICSIVYLNLCYCHPCRLGEHRGPYLELAEIKGGLYNQWMNLHGNLYAASLWSRATHGTVILPITGKTRKSFKVKLELTAMEEIPLPDIWDLPFMHKQLARKGINVCYPSAEWHKNTSEYKRLILPVRTSGLDPGYSPERTILEAKRLGLQNRVTNQIFVGTFNFGGVEIPLNASNYFDPHLTFSRDIALSLQFSFPIIKLSNRVLQQLQAFAGDREIIGIHLRLEADWDIGSVSQAESYINEYKSLVEIFSSKSSRGIVLYLAHGDIPHDIEEKVKLFLKPYAHVRKNDFLGSGDLNSVCYECQGAIDAEVLMQVHYFIGCAPSSFSYVISEYRNHIGLPFEMMRKPGFSIFYPVLSPRKNMWMELNGQDMPYANELYPHISGPKEFLKIARDSASGNEPSDKVSTHTYQVMYGIFLMPLANSYKRNGKKLRILEIGMGCDMYYGPGKSVAIWKNLFQNSGIIWEADYNATCVENAIKNHQLDGINALVGDQANRDVLRKWVGTISGNLDVIIDDGGHTNEMIYNTFDILFNQVLAPGGLYFIEDLHVGRLHAPFNGTSMSALIQGWIEQLLIPNRYVNKDVASTKIRKNFPIPANIQWIFCQAEACVISKCESLTNCKPSDYRD